MTVSVLDRELSLANAAESMNSLSECGCLTGTERRLKVRQNLFATCEVPHSRNRNFTGREEILSDLQAALSSGKATALTQAIHGLGGVGKTQLAVEYAYRHGSNYSLVWW